MLQITANDVQPPRHDILQGLAWLLSTHPSISMIHASASVSKPKVWSTVVQRKLCGSQGFEARMILIGDGPFNIGEAR